ncbi:hypothetical protein TNCV_3987741, partial [Trichonephila clavipes]
MTLSNYANSKNTDDCDDARPTGYSDKKKHKE